jgi:hypothetical protein
MRLYLWVMALMMATSILDQLIGLHKTLKGEPRQPPMDYAVSAILVTWLFVWTCVELRGLP